MTHVLYHKYSLNYSFFLLILYFNRQKESTDEILRLVIQERQRILIKKRTCVDKKEWSKEKTKRYIVLNSFT